MGNKRYSNTHHIVKHMKNKEFEYFKSEIVNKGYL